MIKFMVDSASDLKAERDLCDYFVPVSINIDGKEYFDGIDIDSDTYYQKLKQSEHMPQTSQPSPQAFLRYFEEVRDSKDELIYFALSSKLSGTYQSAMLAKEISGYDKIYIVDTRAVTHMIGILLKYAISLKNSGCLATEIVEQCEQLKSRIHVYAGLDTLEYLRRGGRLSNASAVVATIAHLKPIITVDTNGEVQSIGKTLGKGKAIKFIRDKIKGYEIDPAFPIYSLFSYGEKNCAAFEKKLCEEGYGLSERLQIGSAIGTHIGPDAYGVIFVEKAHKETEE